MIETFDGEEVSRYEDYEDWEYSLVLVRRKVEGTLAERVLRRVGKTSGRVESVERDYSSGTCEICGYGEEGITILVDGCIVFQVYEDDGTYYYQEDMPEIVSPYVKFNGWLDGDTEGMVDFEPYNEPEDKER